MDDPEVLLRFRTYEEFWCFCFSQCRDFKLGCAVRCELREKLGIPPFGKSYLGKMQTYQDAIEAIINQSAMPPQDLLVEIEEFIRKENGHGYATKEDFLRDAVRWRLRNVSGEYKHVEILKEKYDRGEAAIKEMRLPFLGIADYLDKQLETLLEKNSELNQGEEEQGRSRGKRSG